MKSLMRDKVVILVLFLISTVADYLILSKPSPLTIDILCGLRAVSKLAIDAYMAIGFYKALSTIIRLKKKHSPYVFNKRKVLKARS